LHEKILKIDALYANYGSIEALKGINMEVRKGDIVTIIGANGAGKTSTLMSISGLIPSKRGDIYFNNKQINHLKGHQITKLGIIQVPEGRSIFNKMTVLENLEMGAYTNPSKKESNSKIELVFTYFPKLKDRYKQIAGTLSGGEQQMLAIGRAMMSNPQLLLLDEPSLGLAPIVVEEIFEIILKLNKTGITILLVEQNARLALEISNKGYVLENGKIILEGMSEELIGNDGVIKAYLGG
jgi:branched-chain amino acid transport system ATP-binding protein